MIDKNKYYKPSELKSLHPFFEVFKRKSRQALYNFISNNLKKTEYKTNTGKRYLIKGKDILDYIAKIEK